MSKGENKEKRALELEQQWRENYGPFLELLKTKEASF
jgi:hypothetical protein